MKKTNKCKDQKSCQHLADPRVQNGGQGPGPLAQHASSFILTMLFWSASTLQFIGVLESFMQEGCKGCPFGRREGAARELLLGCDCAPGIVWAPYVGGVALRSTQATLMLWPSNLTLRPKEPEDLPYSWVCTPLLIIAWLHVYRAIFWGDWWRLGDPLPTNSRLGSWLIQMLVKHNDRTH